MSHNYRSEHDSLAMVMTMDALFVGNSRADIFGRIFVSITNTFRQSAVVGKSLAVVLVEIVEKFNLKMRRLLFFIAR